MTKPDREKSYDVNRPNNLSSKKVSVKDSAITISSK